MWDIIALDKIGFSWNIKQRVKEAALGYELIAG